METAIDHSCAVAFYGLEISSCRLVNLRTNFGVNASKAKHVICHKNLPVTGADAPIPIVSTLDDFAIDARQAQQCLP